MPTATITPPDDLIRLKVRFLEADAAYKQILSTFPTGEQIVMMMRNGLTAIADEDAQRSHDALGLCAGLAKLIQQHEWWRTQPSRPDADRALFEAANRRLGETVERRDSRD